MNNIPRLLFVRPLGFIYHSNKKGNSDNWKYSESTWDGGKKRVTELCVYYDVNYRNKANGEDKHICKTYTAIYVEEFDF